MTDRRTFLAGAAVAPLLPAASAAAPANGTDTAWRAFLAVHAEYKALEGRFLEANNALPEWEPPRVNLPSVWNGEGKPVTLRQLREERERDDMIHGPSERFEETLYRALGQIRELRERRTPEAIAERQALYDRLEAELVQQEPAPEQKAAYQIGLAVDAAGDRVAKAEDAVIEAPVLTIEDAVRKLQIAAEHMEPLGDDFSDRIVGSVLDGLRRMTA